jgi:hypothetical protein
MARTLLIAKAGRYEGARITDGVSLAWAALCHCCRKPSSSGKALRRRSPERVYLELVLRGAESTVYTLETAYPLAYGAALARWCSGKAWLADPPFGGQNELCRT